MQCRQNLADAARSDDTLRKLVDDNQAAFAAVGLGSLPDLDGAMGWVRAVEAAVTSWAGQPQCCSAAHVEHDTVQIA